MTKTEMIAGYEETVRAFIVSPTLYFALLVCILLFSYLYRFKSTPHAATISFTGIFLSLFTLTASMFVPFSHYENRMSALENNRAVGVSQWEAEYVAPYVHTLPTKQTTDIGINYPTSYANDYTIILFENDQKHTIPFKNVHFVKDVYVPYITYVQLDETISTKYQKGNIYNINLYLPIAESPAK